MTYGEQLWRLGIPIFSNNIWCHDKILAKNILKKQVVVFFEYQKSLLVDCHDYG